MAEDKLNIQKLNELYSKSESVDQDLYSEMRSNVLMVSGKHFEKTSKRIAQRLRDSSANPETKVRLVKNHIHRITRVYINEILSQAPGVRAVPHSESELGDQKAAEIANAVIQDAKHRYNLRSKIRDWCEDYIDLGECAVKVFWDPNKGEIVGYEQEVDKEGNPLFEDVMGQTTIEPQMLDPLGQPVGENTPKKSNRAVYSGDFVFETILPFNLLRDPAAESMEDSRYLIVRKMVDIEDAKNFAGEDEEKLKFVTESANSTFKVFNAQKGDFQDGKNQVMIREYFWKPCKKYPEGRYVLATELGILIGEDENLVTLPFGVFPIAWCGFQKIQTQPRAHSIIRNLRPLQANINQLASQAVQHQLTVGDDKLLIQGGTKIERGGELPGVRVIKFTGTEPTFQAGRTGDQFIAPLQAAVQEMYEIANLQDIKEDLPAQMDPNALLFRSLRHKKKFSLYAETFEQFLKDLFTIYLKLARNYLDDQAMIRKIGKREMVNIPEFKNMSEQDYLLKLEPVGDDIESMVGKSLQYQNILQYVGKDLTKEERGMILSTMPFNNGDKAFESFAVDARNADSDILSLDRGTAVPARKGENHSYIIQRLNGRMKQRDYEQLPEEIKALYEQKLVEHEQIAADEISKLKALQSELIPTGGGMVGVDLFQEMPNTKGGTKQVRMRLPQEALMWLAKTLQQQGIAQAQFEEIGQAAGAGVAEQYLQKNPSAASSGGGSLPMNPQQTAKPGQGAMNGNEPNQSREPNTGFGANQLAI